MVFPFWLNTTVKVPLVDGYLLLTNVPFQVPAICPPEAFAVAGALDAAELVITAEALAELPAADEVAAAVDTFVPPDELHPAVSSTHAVNTVTAHLWYIALRLRRFGVLRTSRDAAMEALKNAVRAMSRTRERFCH
ncbi:MAG: hypothetical protein ABJB98_01710 [Actinomycetota bacterium]